MSAPDRPQIVPVACVAGDEGAWIVDHVVALRGDTLPQAARLDRIESAPRVAGAAWTLRGATSHVRYAARAEIASLEAKQSALGRADANRAALIPITKSPEWWALAQDERRAIMEERSRHFTIGAEYVRAVARKLYHGRDLGEPFDFLTWFEYAERDEPLFDELLARLRLSEEWRYVEREVEVRLRRS